MKTKVFFSAGRLAVLALACITTLSFNACGQDDDGKPEKPVNPVEEPIDEETLSDKTTPVEFKFSYSNENFLFDYAGDNYVGSDTIKAYRKTIDLRQGKHHLVSISQLNIWEEGRSRGVNFRPSTKQVVNTEDRFVFIHNMAFFETDLEVSPYLLPTQEVNYNRYLTFTVRIKVTDASQNLTMPEKIESGGSVSYTEPVIGKIKGIPHPNTIYLDKDDYTEYDTGEGLTATVGVHYDYYEHPEALKHLCIDIKGIRALCPPKGFEDIQPIAEIYDRDGKAMATTTLPKISLLRGYTTILEGPLFSGTTADWKVTMEPYKNY